uniref:Uncharacterized protein n=1 Tax=Oryza barthii TaxID=65489 RepID=A0A0D3FTT8_9ORYZ
MSSSLPCLAVAVLSLLALANSNHLPASVTSAAGRGRSAIPRGHIAAMKFLYAVNDEQQDTMRNGATRLELVAKELLFQFGWRSTYRIS